MEWITEQQHNLVMEILMFQLGELPADHEAIYDLTTAINRIDELAVEIGWVEN